MLTDFKEGAVEAEAQKLAIAHGVALWINAAR